MQERISNPSETPSGGHRFAGWRAAALAVVATAVVLSGCGKAYEQPEKPAQEMPDALEPVEVDLGQFDFTIPNSKTNSTIMVDFHAFATLPRYKSHELTPVLESHANRFRHDVLLRVRKLNRTALNDPDLANLRGEVRGALNAVLPENKIDRVGFYHFRFLEE